jgi:hypothetical protein
MSGKADPDDWRTWERDGICLYVPDGAPPEQRYAAMWTMACEEQGVDPGDAPPLRPGMIGLIRRPRR